MQPRQRASAFRQDRGRLAGIEELLAMMGSHEFGLEPTGSSARNRGHRVQPAESRQRSVLSVLPEVGAGSLECLAHHIRALLGPVRIPVLHRQSMTLRMRFESARADAAFA